MKICFVTGGSGFVGRSLIARLTAEGYSVLALSRSERTDAVLTTLGATPHRGDLSNPKLLETVLRGCDTVFHLAASVDFWADEKALWADHVTGTEHVLQAAQRTGVQTFIYLGASSVIMNGQPITDADESFVSAHLQDGYSRTKLAAEKRVLAANQTGFRTVVIRPPLIWGKGDTSALPQLIEAAQKGQLTFIGGGNHLFSTSHVQNVCHAMLLAATTTTIGGEVFFVTDGEPQVFKAFIKAMLSTQGVAAPDRSVPLGVARFMGALLGGIWRTFRLAGHPPLYPGIVNTLGLPFTLSITRIRQRLGYSPIISVAEGMRDMQITAKTIHSR